MRPALALLKGSQRPHLTQRKSFYSRAGPRLVSLSPSFSSAAYAFACQGGLNSWVVLWGRFEEDLGAERSMAHFILAIKF